jgi:hypothetical protein
VSINITLQQAVYRSDAATAQLFGGNVVFTKDFLDQGGPFEWMVDTLQLQTLRFPGGTVTEELFAPGSTFTEKFFNLTNPEGFINGGTTRIATAPALFQFAGYRETPIKFVLPTDNYLSDETDADGNRLTSDFGLYRLLDRADRMIRGEYGEVTIDTFMIGNEFWYMDSRQTAVEYGRIANEMANGLQFIFDRYREELDDPDAWVEPNIAIQAGRGWRPDENAALIDMLDMDARAAIDTVLQHFYPRFYQHVANSPGTFDRMDEFANAEGFGDLTYYVSEWNTFLAEESDKGLMQASTLLETMRFMMQRGVDEATIWGLQYQNLNGRLATLTLDPNDPDGWTSTLTAGGEVFRMMNPSLIGTRVLDIDTPAHLRSHLLQPPEDRPEGSREQAVMHAWGSDERVVLFLSSRTDVALDFTLDVNGLIPDWHHVWMMQMGVMDDPLTVRDEGDPTSNFARPFLTTESGGTLGQGGVFNLSLDPWEVARIEFTIGDVGVQMWGQDSIVDPAAQYGHVHYGSRFDDVIAGGVGNNILHGGAGNDTLIGGPGDDELHGEDGDDLLIAGAGSNLLRGGFGVDHFAVSVLGETVIADFRPAFGETLSFLGRYDTPEEVLARTTTGSFEPGGDPVDLIIDHEAGGLTVLLGAASDFDAFVGSLSDFDPDSEVVPELQRLGVYERPPELPELPEPRMRDTDLLNEFAAKAVSSDVSKFRAYLAGLDREDLLDLAELINPNIFTLFTGPPFGLFLEALGDQDAISNFLDRLWEGGIDARIEGRLESGEVPVVQDPIALIEIAKRISSDLGARIAAHPGENRAEFLDRVLSVLKSQDVPPDALTMFDQVEIEVDENGNYVVAGVKDPTSPAPPPPPPDDDPPDDDDDTGSGPPVTAGGCFVATTAYGDREHPDVAALRWWRAHVLARSAAGRAFCHVYYHHAGPWAARRIAGRPRLRRYVLSALSVLARAIRNRHGAGVWPGRQG